MSAASGSKVKAPAFQTAEFEGEPMFVDAVAEARRAGSFNTKEGARRAGELTSQINSSTMRDLQDAMDTMFGGDGSFQRQREATNEGIESRLRGEVSEGARNQIAQSVLRSGVSELGRGAVDDSFAGFLGLTREQLATQGAQEYRSMYGLYRQSFPLMSGGEAMGYTGLSTGQAIQAAQGNSQLQAQYHSMEYAAALNNSINSYQAALTSAQYAAAPDPGAQAESSMWSTVLGVAGAAVGFAVGGPAGAAGGYMLGSAAGSAVGGA